jgi:hypothetical protein
MGQKINPVSLRLQSTNRHFDNCWYGNSFYKNLINKDILLQHYLDNFLKLLRLPTGRYSIQHLQKKTQVYNFFCYSKSTREWRSKVFGLATKKNYLKKNRYFFKNKFEFKKRRKKVTKFTDFYTGLNQLAVYKIQKRITSFQNFRVWSLLQKTTQIPHSRSFGARPFGSEKSTNNWLSTKSDFRWKNLSSYLGTKSSFLQTNYASIPDFQWTHRKKLNPSKLPFQRNPSGFRTFQQHFLIEKRNESNLKKKHTNSKKNPSGNHDKKSQNSMIQTGFAQNLGLHQNQQFLSNRKDNSNFLFLQNLFVYKILKSHLKKKSKTPGSSLFVSHFNKKKFMRALFQQNHDFVKNQNSMNLHHHNFDTLNSKHKNYLESSLSSFYNLELNVIPFKVQNDWQHANFLADEIVYFLEKRIPFRRLKNQILKQLSKISTIRGVRIVCSGRVGGKSKKAQRAKTECIKYGQTSLQVFSSKIDFSIKTAFTSFGSVGVKVWICYF